MMVIVIIPPPALSILPAGPGRSHKVGLTVGEMRGSRGWENTTILLCVGRVSPTYQSINENIFVNLTFVGC